MDERRKRKNGSTSDNFVDRAARDATRNVRLRTRQALRGTTEVTVDLFSIVMFALVRITRDMALRPIVTKQKRVYAFGPNLSDEHTLRNRIAVYDRGVHPQKWKLLQVPLAWIPCGDRMVACPSIGEIAIRKSGALLGTLINGKVSLSARGSRAQCVLYACGHAKPSENHTADHVDFTQPLNDSIDNLRWASMVEQVKNRRANTFVKSDATTIRIYNLENVLVGEFHSPLEASKFLKSTRNTICRHITSGALFDGRFYIRSVPSQMEGVLLPPHPTLYDTLQMSSTGMYRTFAQRKGWSIWRYASPRTTDNRCVTCLNGKMRYIYRLAVESLLERELCDDEEVDHTNGSVTDNSASNLAVLTRRGNMERATIRIVTSEDADGATTIFGSPTHAAENLGTSPTNIFHCLSGLYKSSANRSWRDSSVEEIDHFFQHVASVDVDASVAQLASHPRYAELCRLLALFHERQAALVRIGL